MQPPRIDDAEPEAQRGIQHLRLDALREVDAEEIPPDLARRGRRLAERFDHAHSALRRAVLPLVTQAVHRVPLGTAVALVDDERPRARARRAGPHVETLMPPPLLRARRHAVALRADPLVDRRHQLRRLLARHQPERSDRPGIVAEREARLDRVQLVHRRSDPVAEAAVDQRLRRPQRSERLPARMDVVELEAHHRRQYSLPPVRRQHADPRDARARQLAAGDRHRIRHPRRNADEPAVRRRRRARGRPASSP